MTEIAIVIGGGSGVWLELNEARELIGEREALLIGCNHAARDVADPLDAFVTMHPDLLPMWLKSRAEQGHPPPAKIYHASHRARAPVESTPVESWGGSSGLLCVKVALDLGCTKIILCGVPMHQNACHYDRLNRRWSEAAQYHRSWEKRLPEMQGKVKSCSGWTARLLGSPDRNWINGDEGTT